MAKRVSEYRITDENTDPYLLDEVIAFFKQKGKKKVYSYAKGQVCFSHRGCYWLVSPETMKYAPRHRSNEKWYKEHSLENIWGGINKWLDYRDLKRKEREEGE
jgi:hypothetical protein